MERRKKKQRLQDYRWFTARINVIEKELSKPTTAERVRFDGSKAERDAVRNVTKAEALMKEKEKLEIKKAAIENAINSMEDSKESILLKLMYINGKSPKEISADMKLSIKTIYKIHDAALNGINLDATVSAQNRSD